MSTKVYRGGAGHGGVGGRLARRKSRRPLPLPKRAIQDRKACLSPEATCHVDEDYVNLGHRHRLTYLRYPSGSGKRPPPKPKRMTALQEVSSPPPPQLRSPSPPAVATPTKPHNIKKPKPPRPPLPKMGLRHHHHTPPDHHQQKLASVLTTPTGHTPKLATSHTPRLPPVPSQHQKKLMTTSLDSILNKQQQQKATPTRPRPIPPKPQVPVVRPDRQDQDRHLHFNGFTKDPSLPQASPPSPAMLRPPPPKKQSSNSSNSSSSSSSSNSSSNSSNSSSSSSSSSSNSSSNSSSSSKLAKQPLLPPSVKPRKPPKPSGRNNLLQSEPGIQNNTHHPSPPATPISPPSFTSIATKSSPPPLLLLSSSPDKFSHLPRAHVPEAPQTTTTKAPLPKPRPRRPSRGEEAAAALEESGSLPVPVARKRLGSRGAGGSSEEIATSSSSSSSTVAPPLLPRPKARALANSGEKTPSLSVQVQPTQQKLFNAGGKIATPTPRCKRGNKTTTEVEANNYSRVQHKPTPTYATPTVNPYQQRRSRRKGGGIRMPLWKAPPPPSWTPPPPSPVQGNSMKKGEKQNQLALPLSSLQISPPPTTPIATSPTSFILPPFRSSSHSPYPAAPDDGNDDDDPLESSWVMTDFEPPVEIARDPIYSSPTPKSPPVVQFEENLFQYRKGPAFQQHLPINVFKELQGNLHKQIMVRAGT